MTIKEYIFSLPNSMSGYKVEINYFWEGFCKVCKHITVTQDEEYSPSFKSLKEVKEMILGKKGYYMGYAWLFDDTYADEIKITENRIKIDIVEEIPDFELY